MKSIGGYFEMELNPGKHHHSEALGINLGRNALRLILREKNYEKIYLPYFCCSDVFESLQKEKTELEGYHINADLEPIFDFDNIKENEAFLYINYFGFKRKFSEQLHKRLLNLILDNSQDYFFKPNDKKLMCFNSARKFFGVPDGSFLYNCTVSEALEVQQFEVFPEHLFLRLQHSAPSGYPHFKEHEGKLDRLPVGKMSKISQYLLRNVNEQKTAQIRNQNFAFLENEFADSNNFPLKKPEGAVPLCYPFLTEKAEELRHHLHQNHIFTPVFWPGILQSKPADKMEKKLTENCVHLPIDQRYGTREMKRISSEVKKVIYG